MFIVLYFGTYNDKLITVVKFKKVKGDKIKYEQDIDVEWVINVKYALARDKRLIHINL